MATAELPRPGVEVVQEFRSAAPTIVRPTLVPFVCGPAKEIIEVTTADGTLNGDAKQGIYAQLPQIISQSAFPSPRGNIAQVDVEEGTIKAFLQFGGQLLQLPRDPGSSFLTAWNNAARAAIETLPDPGSGFSVDGLVLVLAIDQPARLDTTEDVTITFAASSPGGDLSPEQLAEQINSAVGDTVASVTDDDRVLVASKTLGAKSSVTVRAGGSANLILGFTAANEYRVTGAGFRGQDQSNNTTITPWIEWTRGEYLVNGTATSFPAITNMTPGFGLINGAGTFANSQQPNITFTGGGSIDLRVSDVFFGDGTQPVVNAVVKKVETARFKLGVLNTKNSIFDAEGNVVSPVYDDAMVGTLFAAAPYAPNYAWFKAMNLTFSSVPKAAALLGSISGAAALPASVEGASAPAGPFDLTGLTLKVDVTIDGILQDTQTFTFSGPPFADMAAVVAAIGSNINGVASSDDGGKLKLATTRTGAQQALTLLSSSSALDTLGFNPGDQSDTGHDVEFLDIPPTILGGSQTFNFTPGNGETLVIERSTDGGLTWAAGTRTFTFPNNTPVANIAALLAVINTAGNWDGGTLPTTFVITNTVDRIKITGAVGGSLQGIRIGAASTAIGVTSNTDLLFTSGQSDIGEENISGLTLKFQINDRPKTYAALFTSDSLVDAVATINATVGWPVASISGIGSDQLGLSSDLAGMASKIVVVAPDASSTKAANAFGFTPDTPAVGLGRPNPDFYLDISGNVVLGSDILRSQVTGFPFDPGQADLYIQYHGLRKDVSPSASAPALISLSDVATLQTVLNPITQDNPLGLGMFFMMINAPGVLCTGMGVDEAPPSQPDGTLLAYTKVANFIEAQEVYAIAPLTHDETVGQMFKAHVELMEEPEQKGERILFINPLVPTTAIDKLIVSGLNGNSTATTNQFVTDVNPASALVAAGINPADPIPVDDGLYLEITVEGSVRRYNVSSVNGVVISFNVSFSSGENDDGFYSTTPLTETLVNTDYSMKVRGAPLVIPGSDIPDKDKIAATVAEKANSYLYRRMFYTFPDKVRATVNGVDSLLEGFYACAAIAGMVAHFPPQQGFTNLPMVGFSGVQGSNDTFSNRQLNVMAGGGTYIIVQDSKGGPLTSRMQVSTDLTTIEKRELSITKDVDFVAKFLRTGLRNFIGTFNITQPFLDTVSTVIHGMLKFLEENGIINSGDLNNIIQSTDAPDTVLVDILLDVPFPCNYIRLTLVI